MLAINQRYIVCRTCRIDFGSAQNLCENCYLTEDADHKSKHEFLFLDTYHDKSALDSIEKIESFRCKECPGKGESDGAYQAVSRHTLFLVYSTPINPVLVDHYSCLL